LPQNLLMSIVSRPRNNLTLIVNLANRLIPKKITGNVSIKSHQIHFSQIFPYFT